MEKHQNKYNANHDQNLTPQQQNNIYNKNHTSHDTRNQSHHKLYNRKKFTKIHTTTIQQASETTPPPNSGLEKELKQNKQSQHTQIKPNTRAETQRPSKTNKPRQ